MKKKLFLLYFFLLKLSIFQAQTNIKTFSNKSGNASISYTYYQDVKTLENIKHGDYSFQNISNDGKSKYIVKGKYNNGLKDGKWTWNIVSYNYVNRLEYSKYVYNVIKTFSNGNRHGLWHSNKSWQGYKSNNLIINNSWDLLLNYTNNVITDKLTYQENQKLPVVLNFNKQGRLIGDYLLDYAGKIRITCNSKGIVTYYNDYNKDLKINDEALSSAEDFLDGKLTKDEAESKNISINEISMSGYFYDDHVFDEDDIKKPDDGELTQNLKYGRYLLAYYSPDLVELNKIKKQNNKDNEKEIAFKKLMEPINGKKFKYIEGFDKLQNKKNITYNSNNCGNYKIEFQDNKMRMYKQRLLKKEFGNNKCIDFLIKNDGVFSVWDLVYNYQNNTINIGPDEYTIKTITNKIILESKELKMTLEQE